LRLVVHGGCFFEVVGRKGRKERENVEIGRKIGSVVMVSSPYIPKWQVTEISFLLSFFSNL